MKNSTIAITTGIAGIIVLLTTANLKLSAEYKKGNIISSQTAQLLPSFHHIKEICAKNDEGNWGRNISLQQHKDSTAILYNYYSSAGALFSVINDTLFIEPDPSEKHDGYDLTIYFKELKSVQCSNSSVILGRFKGDSLSVKADHHSLFQGGQMDLKRLHVEASNDAHISINSIDTVPSVTIKLQDRARFNADCTIFVEKELIMSRGSSISFSGMSVENFGIKRTLIRK
jgi:hypothetical protein